MTSFGFLYFFVHFQPRPQTPCRPQITAKVPLNMLLGPLFLVRIALYCFTYFFVYFLLPFEAHASHAFSHISYVRHAHRGIQRPRPPPPTPHRSVSLVFISLLNRIQ